MHRIMMKMFKNEQLKLPVEGGLEPDAPAKPKHVKRSKKPNPVDGKILTLRSHENLSNYLKERGKPLNPNELAVVLSTDNFSTYQQRHILDDEGIVNPELNSQALDLLNNSIQSKKDVMSDRKRRTNEGLEMLLERAKLTPTKYHEILDSKDNKYKIDTSPETSDDRIVSVLQNPHLDESHFLKTIEKHPEYVNHVLSHKSTWKNKRILDKALTNEDSLKNIDESRIRDIVDHSSVNEDSLISPNAAKSIIEHTDVAGGFHRPESLDHLLDQVPSEDRKRFIDKKLGISGGEHSDPELAGTEDDWDNWTKGHDYDSKTARKLARSKHLEDSHADFIKRHGSFDEKYDMYNHNTSIDPKHGVEMFDKWKNDDDGHGYNAEELNAKHADDKDNIYTHEHLPEDIRNDIIERANDRGTIDEWAEDSYNYSSFLDDISDEDILSKMGTKFDDADQIYEKLNEDHDWEAENPKAQTDHPHHSKLEEFLSNNDSDTDLETFQSETGHHPSEMGIPYDEESDTVDIDHVKNKLNELGGPSKIDYANHDDLTINEHPEFDERYEQAAKDWRLEHWRDNQSDVADSLYLYEDHRDSDEYQEAYKQAEKDYLEENSKDEVRELYGNSHNEPEFVPTHLHAHIPGFDELQREKIKKVSDGGQAPFLNKQIKDRSHEHSYGENQHHYELAKDYADAKGGSIDIGTLHKLFPNQKEVWKGMFGDKGKLSSGDIQQKIDEIPKTKYDISYGKWDANKMQNANKQDQIIFRLDHSDDSVKALQQDPELYETFKHVQSVSKQSGHPTNDRTIAWARVDFSDPNKPMVDELQSDFGKTVRKYLEDQGHGKKSEHIKAIEEHHKNWRENLLNFIAKTAKKHGAEKLYTHSPESKSQHTGAETAHSVYLDSYKKVPRNMGFKPVEADEMPLTEHGKEHFTAKPSDTPESRAENHHEASKFHYNMYSALPKGDLKTHHMEMTKKHKMEAINLAGSDKDLKKQYSQKLKFEPDDGHAEAVNKVIQENKPASHAADTLFGKPFEQPKPLQGHALDLKPNVLKKHIDEVDDLIKKEEIFNDLRPKVKINPAHGKQIATAYENMKHDPSHPDVKAAYGALIKETGKQYQSLLDKGYKFSKIKENAENPYKSSAHMHEDIANNKHLHYFPTSAGFGSGDAAPEDHPMLQPTKFKDPEGKPMLANDLFRVVHDIHGHHLGGQTGFGPKGEHQAYLTHKKMFSPLAQKALATETLGQNSTVNFGTHGEQNRKDPKNTKYADQKAGLLPAHIISGDWHNE